MRIIPAIDVIDGKCVRLTQGDYDKKKVYNEDPLEVAKSFEDAGLLYLHLVDLDGAKAKRVVNYKSLEKIAGSTKLKIDFGGGLKSDEDLRIVFECGAKQVTIGSSAVTDKPAFLNWLQLYGAEKIILCADVKEEKISISGWQETTDLEITEFITNYRNEGINYVVCTDISKDGMLEGPSFKLYQKILETQPGIKLIASGGVSCMDDIERLSKLKLDGAIIGKAIYEGKIKLSELISFQKKKLSNA